MKQFVFKGFLWILLLAGACQSGDKSLENKEHKTKAPKVLTGSKVNSEGAYLFAGKNILLLNWTEWYEDKSKNVLKMTVFDPVKQKFGEIHTVTPSKGLQMHAESMAKVGMTGSGLLYAVYRKKSPDDRSRFGGKLYYSISKDTGKTWSDERLVVDDPKATSLSFYDLALLPDGELGMTWLDNRKPLDSLHKGKTLFFAKTDGDKGFTAFQPVAGSTCECCRTDIYTDTKGRIHVAYRNQVEPDEPDFDGKGEIEIRDMYYLVSVDTGKTFSRPVRIGIDNWHVSGCPHTGPSLAYNGKGLGAVWFTGKPNAEGLYFAYKPDAVEKFLPKSFVSREGRHPQMIAAGDIFKAVYEEYYEKNGKGYYKITLKNIRPEEETVNSDLDFNHAQKPIHGKTIEISSPETQNNHPVISLVPGQRQILIVWVNNDTRNPKLMYRTLKY